MAFGGNETALQGEVQCSIRFIALSITVRELTYKVRLIAALGLCIPEIETYRTRGSSYL